MINRLLLWVTQFLPARAIDLDGRPYIERYHVWTCGRLAIYLHRYLGADGDRNLHNHPHRWSLGIPLVGGYVESRVTALCPKQGALTQWVEVRPWRWNWIPAGRFHRIARVTPDTWTLFIAWDRFKFWGELTPAGQFRAVPGVQETREDWFKTAPSGRQLRAQRNE